MLVIDTSEIKEYINKSGIKQKAIAERSGIDETKLCLILQGKRKLEASEYANLCKAVNVPMDAFMKQTN